MTKLWNRSVVVGLLIFFLAAVPRLIYALGTDKLGTGAEMERAAINLAQCGELGNIYAPDSGKSAHVAPLYAFLLSLMYSIFGVPNVGGRMAQRIAAVLITSLGIALLPMVSKRLRLHPWAGYVAAIILALSPVNLWIECSGCWEQPYAALALLGLVYAFAALHACQWQSLPLVIGTGLLVGLTALLSPSILPAAGLMLAAELFFQAAQRKQVLRGAFVMLAIGAICVAPWIYRNYRALGGFVAVRSNFGLELWVGNNPEATGRTFGTHADDPNGILWRIHPYSNKQEKAHLKAIGELAYMREKLHQALAWIREHPRRFVDLTLTRAQLYWFPPADMWTPTTSARGLKATFWCLTSLGVLIGAIELLRRRQSYAWILLAGILGPALVYMITHVDVHYRYPALALSVLLCCEALCGFVARYTYSDLATNSVLVQRLQRIWVGSARTQA
jgi:hypothetical protein